MTIEEKAVEFLGYCGAMISGSKLGYHQRHPNNLVVFNANLIAMTNLPYKIWYGDLDLTLSLVKLKEFAASVDLEIRILREPDARFEYEEFPRINAFVLKVQSDGSVELGEHYRDYYSHDELIKLNND